MKKKKASILWHSAFFIIQLSHPYRTTRETTALTIWTFVGKVMSLLFNTLSRFAIAILPKNKYLLILWLQSLSALILDSSNNMLLHPETHLKLLESKQIRVILLHSFRFIITKELVLSNNCGAGEDYLESLGQSRNQICQL